MTSKLKRIKRGATRRARGGKVGPYVARNYIFGLIWIPYYPKQDILDYWGKIIFCLLSYYIISKDKIYRVETIDMGRSHWNNGVSGVDLISIVVITMVLIVRYKILC